MRTISTLLLSCSYVVHALAQSTTCVADNCLRAVRATSASPFPASASTDCSSFLQQTVTPCATTTVTTVTVTNTLAPTSVTETSTVSSTETITDFTTTTSTVTTIEDTLTLTESTVTTETQTVPGQTFTVTVTSTTTPVNVAPRSLGIPANHARQNTCTATTQTASSVPRYASACSGTVRYSSACSCIGVTGATTTLSQSTSTSTTTTTVLVTPTTTVTQVVTTTTSVRVTSTVVSSATLETTAQTLTATTVSTTTTTTTVDVTTTVTVTPICTLYSISVTSGARVGSYLRSNPPIAPLRLGAVGFAGAAQASLWNIYANGTIYAGPLNWRAQIGLDVVTLATDATYALLPSFRPIFCPVAGDAVQGRLLCSLGGVATKFYTCAATGNNLVTSAILPNASIGLCSEVGLSFTKTCA